MKLFHFNKLMALNNVKTHTMLKPTHKSLFGKVNTLDWLLFPSGLHRRQILDRNGENAGKRRTPWFPRHQDAWRRRQRVTKWTDIFAKEWQIWRNFLVEVWQYCHHGVMNNAKKWRLLWLKSKTLSRSKVKQRALINRLVLPSFAEFWFDIHVELR